MINPHETYIVLLYTTNYLKGGVIRLPDLLVILCATVYALIDSLWLEYMQTLLEKIT